ncbi:MAG: protein BatD, partial [Elusimicrobia bacterium]|nr:protein BatD [Elusimicrobiota bacterium]
MRRIPIFLFMAVLALCSRLDAQIEVSASINNSVIALNEQAEVRVTVSGNAKSISEPVVPAIDNFQIAGSGRSQNISIVNGSMTSSFVYSYILYPKKTGDFVIPPFTVNYRNTRYSTEPLNIKVVKEKEYNLGAPSAGTAPGAPPEMYVEQDLDLPQAYVGQQVTYVFKFYRRVNLVSNPSFEAPDFKGFIKEDLPPNKTYRANIKGMQYMVTEVRFALFPISSGDYVIPQARLIVTVEDVFSADDFFSRFFSEGKKKALTTSPLEVHIKPLPEEGRPSGFSGAVGEYDVKISLDKQTVKQGEPVTLSVDIEGVGDPKTIKAP